ncbi:MAG: acyl-CoA dehydratase activase-related protein [Syntrophobacteria bacterium]
MIDLEREQLATHSSLPPHNGNDFSGHETTGLRSPAGAPVVGIPRGLLYFRYQPLWTTFFSHLGVTVEVSQPTERSRFESAQSLTRSDLCLPVKVFLDHVARLKDSVDYLLLPRVISVSPDAYMCPKILGLTDMVRNVFPKLPDLLTPRINAKLPKPEGFAGACFEVGHHFDNSQARVEKAWEAAQKAQIEFEQRLLSYPLDEALSPWDETFGKQQSKSGLQSRYRVAVIGRPYISFDKALSHDLLSLLKRYGVQIVTPESLPREVKDKESQKLSKKVYWQLGKELVAAAMHYMQCADVDGIINVSSFGCGQDSFTNALVEHYVTKYSNKPYLNLVLDEHTADAGLNTRVEAFLDMVDQRKKIGVFGSRVVEEEVEPFSSKRFVKQPTSPEMHLTIPHMGHLHIGFEQVFKNLGVDIIMPPRPNKEALMLGTRYSPECACLPFKLNLGNMIQALNQGATDIMMTGGFGPCRFGYYSVIQEQILRDLGYEFRMGRADDPDSLRDMLDMVKRIAGLNTKWDSYKVFFFILYRLALVDWALRRAHWLRPREIDRRATDRALGGSMKIIEETRRFRDLWQARRKVGKILATVAHDRSRSVLRVGIVGEIFMVLENYANMNVEERLGEMGVEIHRGVWLSDWLNDRYRFKLFRRNQFKWSLRQAAPYLREPSGGESVKSVGKSVAFAKKGFDGIVHLMPFTCMPELVAQTILDKVSRDYNIPVLTLIFDEHTSPGGVQTRLEAFVDLINHSKGFAV